MSLQWKQLGNRLSSAELPGGIDLYIEEVHIRATGERFYEAKVLNHG